MSIFSPSDATITVKCPTPGCQDRLPLHRSLEAHSGLRGACNGCGGAFRLVGGHLVEAQPGIAPRQARPG